MPNFSGLWTSRQQLQAKGVNIWPATPGAPTIGTATDVGNAGGQVSVTFTAPAYAGYPAVITGYTVTSSPSGITNTGASSPIVVSGLTNGTAYTFTVRATNATGTGPASAASNSATPTAYVYPGTLTQAYFLLDNTPSNTLRYTYSGNTVANATSLTITQGTGAASGNSILGIFLQGNVTSLTSKIVYASNVTGSAATMNGTGSGMSYSSGCGNSTKGVFTVGSTSSPGGSTLTYTYSSDAVAAGGQAPTYGFIGCAAGTSSFGIFANGAGPTNDLRFKYTYSGDSTASATSASNGSYYGAACGPSTYGIFALGYTSSASNITNKYTYSGDTSAVSTSLTANGYGMAAGGGNSVGIFVIANSTTTTNVWTYSGDTVAAGTNLTGGNVSSGIGASNGTTGVNV
jgi:trimeric autotransporter adhesin